MTEVSQKSPPDINVKNQKADTSPTSEQNQPLPRIGVTMGDAAGVGPEIILKALSKLEEKHDYLPIVIGDARCLKGIAKQLNLKVDFEVVKKGEDLPSFSNKVIVYDLENIVDEITPGLESGISGKASAEYIRNAVELSLNGRIDAIATAPISKRALALGGNEFPGHTEMLAFLTGTKDFAMSFFADRLRVVLLSTHVSLSDAIARVKKDPLVELIRFTDRELSKLLRRKIRIAVAGLNPHASEGGMFGTEEETEIAPAIEICRESSGIEVSGPYSPDTIFLRGFRGEFDAVISCYHDQATIAVKCLSFGRSVNVTLGLPIIRTSVDHGTAFDIAGRGIADCSSMETAISLAAKLSSGAVS